MRVRTIGIVGLGLLVAACGDTSNDRMATGGLGGAAVGALVAGPVGAIVGGGVGLAGGAALDKSADEKINEFANQPSDDTRQMASASGAADRGRLMSKEQVHRGLHDDGYARVYNIRREGSTYLARGERDGRAYDIRADAYNGRIISSDDVGRAQRREAASGSPASAAMSEQQVRDTLRRDGYEMIGPLDRTGNNYRTQVRHNGEVFNVTLDRRTARVIQATPVRTDDPQGGTATVPPRQGG